VLRVELRQYDAHLHLGHPGRRRACGALLTCLGGLQYVFVIVAPCIACQRQVHFGGHRQSGSEVSRLGHAVGCLGLAFALSGELGEKIRHASSLEHIADIKAEQRRKIL